MKIKVINKQHQYYGQEFEPIKMNYDNVLIRINGEKLILSNKDIEILPENKYEENIREYRDLLKITLNRGISIVLYTALLNCIEQKIGDALKNIEVLMDEFNVIRKTMWEKSLVLLINDSIPMEIKVTGAKYDNIYNIKLREIVLEDFIDGCFGEIGDIDKQIKELEAKKDKYNKSVINALDLKNKSKGTKYEKLMPGA